MVPLAWRVKVFSSFLLLTLLYVFLSSRRSMEQWKGLLRLYSTHPPSSRGTITTYSPQHRKAARIATYAGQPRNTSFLLKHILFPKTDLPYSEHAAIFSSLQGLSPSTTTWWHLPCSNWDLRLSPGTANLRFLGTLLVSNRWPPGAANGSQRTHIHQPWH